MKRQRFYILFFIPLFTACLESPNMTTGIVNGKEEPTVLTEKTNPFHNDGNLFFQGEIKAKGKSEITERGFCWSTTSDNPGKSDSIIRVPGADSDIFSCELKRVRGDSTTYYWRAFASNKYGDDYGDVQSCQTPKIWEKKETLPAHARGRGAVFILDNKIYMTCGQSLSGGGLNNTWRYNIADDNDKWTEKAKFIGDERIDPVAFTIGNFAFVGTGRKEGENSKDFYQYNSTLDFWTEIATPDDLEVRYQAVAFSLNGKGYLVGGLSSPRGKLNDVWQYDADANFWKRMNNFPVDFSGGISISGNNQAFVGFGNTSSEFQRTLWKYDEENDKWDKFATLSDDVGRTIYSGVIIQNTIYIVDEKNKIWACNISNERKTWEEKTDLPSAFLYEHPEYISSGNQLLFTTGKTNSIYVGLGFSKYLYEYRPLWNN